MRRDRKMKLQEISIKYITQCVLVHLSLALAYRGNLSHSSESAEPSSQKYIHTYNNTHAFKVRTALDPDSEPRLQDQGIYVWAQTMQLLFIGILLVEIS